MDNLKSLTRLFEPGKIGGMAVRNRVVMPPIQTRGADEDGFVSDPLIDYYRARAKGGAGLIIVQQSFAWPGAKLTRGIALWEDFFIPRLGDLAAAIRESGARAAIQIGGRGTMQDEGMEAVAPSPVPDYSNDTVPRELTKQEIWFYVKAFAEAACRIREAGFDALEIHGAHGHLVSQFLSPYTNRRNDEFGGNVANRARFACLILNEIRKNLGPDFPVIFRMNGDDFIEGGLTIEEAIEQAEMLVRAGADALHVSGSCHETIWHHFPPYMFPPGNLVHLASRVKKKVSVPVITVGKINDPFLAEQILLDGKADFVSMGRALIADPDLPNKAREGRFDDIRRCLYCCNCLNWEQNPRLRNRGISCTVNPAVLREREFSTNPAEKSKKVMVVGGGPAGMEAACVLGERGHSVSLYERNVKLGGQWIIASRGEDKEDYRTLIPYMIRRLREAGVGIHLDREVSLSFILEERPDHIIVATGALPVSIETDFPAEQGPALVQATDVLMGEAEVEDPVVVAGGRSIGMEAALVLAREGRHVSLVESLELGNRLHIGIRSTLRNRLVEMGVHVYTHSKVMRVTPSGVDVANSGTLLHLNAGTVVLAIGVRPLRDLINDLKDKGVPFHAVGDCSDPRDAMEAINEGAEIGRII
ncbi:FAD-dependent oxidoreductase [Thermodesulfobacteriota bacterium]